MKTPKKKLRAIPRHGFKYTIETPDGQEVKTIYVKTKYGVDRVKMNMIVADVRRALALKGVGNTRLCAGAVCTWRHRKAFSHQVVGGVDWQDSRAYVISKQDKTTGMPTECVAYRHNEDIAALFDGATPGGQQKLLAELEKNGGRTITLLPMKRRPSGAYNKTKKNGHGKQKLNPDGSRSKDYTRTPRTGAMLRFLRTRPGITV